MSEIRPLQKSDKRQGFSSGHPELDHYFHRYAGQNQFRHHIGVTYVALQEDTICGYMTVASGSIEKDPLLPVGKGLPSAYPLPILRLGRLAVDQRFQGKGVGKELLRYLFLLALHQKATTGCIGIIVDAKPEAISFYEAYGFIQLPGVTEGEVRGYPQPVLMFLSIKSIAEP